MKLDDKFSWTWKDILWPFWIFFAITFGIIFALFLMVVSKIYQCINKEITTYEGTFYISIKYIIIITIIILLLVKGILWMFLILCLNNILLCLMVMGVYKSLDEENDDILMVSLYFNAG